MNKDTFTIAGADIAKILGIVLIALGLNNLVLSVLHSRITEDALSIAINLASGGVLLLIGTACLLIYYSSIIKEVKSKQSKVF